MAASREFLLDLYFHVALPRDVPRAHRHLDKLNSELLERMTDAVKTVTGVSPIEHQARLDSVRVTLTTTKALNVEGKVDKSLLVKEVAKLQRNYMLILQVTEQNCALLVYKHHDGSPDEKLVFEAFEASATCEKVLASEGSLLWDFPSYSVQLPPQVYSDNCFLEELSRFVEQASIESVKQFSAVTHKASAPIHEIRDTTDPALISTLLMTILETNGAKYEPPILQKRVRDTVCFEEARKPWRRSPFYLILRVAIQRHLYMTLGADIGRTYYKSIMCVLVSRLLDDCIMAIPHEASHFLEQKLGRRLAKLETDRANIAESAKKVHDFLFSSLHAVFEKSLKAATKFLEEQWRTHSSKTRRIINLLPGYAGMSEMFLQLPLSGPTLNQVAFEGVYGSKKQQISSSQLLEEYEKSDASAKPFITIANRYLGVMNYTENKIPPFLEDVGNANGATNDIGSNSPSNSGQDTLSAHARCCQLAKTVESYISLTGGAYDGYGLLKSKFLLNLMELWVEMDRNAVICYPLMRRYHPGFDPKMLDSLELLSLSDMERLQRVQIYLGRRTQGWRGTGSKTILDIPADDSFAVVYYDTCGDLTGLKELRRTIERKAEEARVAKELEWRELSREHERLMQCVAESTCPYNTRVAADGSVVIEHARGCLKHKYKWQAKQIKIKVFEHPLPNSESAAKAAIFELDCPRAFAAYRDATWSLLATFAYLGDRPTDNVTLLRSYSGLARYTNGSASRVSLGSETKSHLDCHYAESNFPVALHQICRPCGLNPSYFDTSSRTWTARRETPSFSHHFPLTLPEGSPYRALRLTEVSSCWPSSNDALASQTKCPSDLNVHEFMAWQGLLNGTHTRWLSLLRELGSTNLNFSTESTWAVVTKLVLQVGPSSAGCALRDIHAVFADASYCRKLLDQIRHRLEVIRCNWRESIQMDILISLLLKLSSLSRVSEGTSSEVLGLIDVARTITWDWCVTLQSWSLNDGSPEATISAVWASVLCKRTFQAFEQSTSNMSFPALDCFVGASIMLQENLVCRFELLPHTLRRAILQDLHYTYNTREIIRSAILADHRALLYALNQIWPMPEEPLACPPHIRVLPGTWWVEVSMITKDHGVHYVHYNLLLGHLLIDGKQSGALPAEYRGDPLIQRLFGTQNLRVLPSYKPGMDLFIAQPMPYRHWVHLGFRNSRLIVRAVQSDRVLEFIPSDIFKEGSKYDLPSPLVDNCYHWLDLHTKVLEIRQDDKWKSKDSNWKLDLRTRRATRHDWTLVDPNSRVAQKIARNFSFFEYACHITVFQPSESRLRVELKRLELGFFVNKSRLLQCLQLGAEIAPTEFQDPGVWYGLRSKLILRSTMNPCRRSILVPVGPFRICREVQHVKIVIHNEGTFLKFEINEVLRRLECPAEPRLLYTKALWHAYTSHFLPDPLTGRTGVEEALSLLQSGMYQPWSFLCGPLLSILHDIAKLSPRRAYYPAHLKCMETIHWNQDMTTTIQDDRYRSIVERIYQRSAELSLFDTNHTVVDAPKCPTGDTHLEARAIARSSAVVRTQHQVYRSRAFPKKSLSRENVATTSIVLSQWPQRLRNTTSLASLLEEHPVIGGHIGVFERVQLFDRLCLDLAENWGSLVQYAIQCGPQDKYRLLFQFAPMAFSNSARMDLLQVLLSYAILDELKNIRLPNFPSYLRFRADEVAGVKDLAVLMNDARIPHVAEPIQPGNRPGQLALARIQHEEKSQRSCVELARSIRAQWPSVEIDRNELAPIDPTFLDVDKALDLVTEEWCRLTQNFEYSRYLAAVQVVLDEYRIPDSQPSSDVLQAALKSSSQCTTEFLVHYPGRVRGGEQPLVRDLLNKLNSFSASSPVRDPEGVPCDTVHPQINNVRFLDPGCLPSVRDAPKHIEELHRIVSELKFSSSSVQRTYATEMEHSIDALVRHITQPPVRLPDFNPSALDREIQQAWNVCAGLLNTIVAAMAEGDGRARWLQPAGLWPKLNAATLISELGSTSTSLLGKYAKEVLVTLGLRITALQRLLRIQDAARKGKHQQLYEERANPGHTNWSPLTHTNWLLLEIDNDMMFRAEQVDVANATILPISGQNSVVQLLMGKGKTSCILPMVAAVLADRRNLLRVIVPRTLLLQCAQVLQIKLGGLLGRELVHVPFSRKTPTHRGLLQIFGQLHSEMKKNGGVLLCLPEHLLSFKLSGMQRLCDGNIEEATIMIKFQSWLDRHARDVLDESDVSLAIRTQLIYPSGSQMTVDGHPLRWQTVQAVLRLLWLYLPNLEHQFPRSIEVVQRPVGEYPLVYFLRRDVEDHLVGRLVNDICEGQLVCLPRGEIPSSSKDDLRAFISSPVVSLHSVKEVAAMYRDKQHLLKVLYLLRGLFVHRIFLSTLKKRWNVQYGLHPQRDPIAVPFYAKGVPSPSSEWGHPDVAIILTCLSFYYQGLDLAQFKQAFEQLLKSDEPSIEYEKWTTHHLPESLRDYNAINIENSSQLHDLHHHIRFNVYLLDFYLNTFVFPRHAKQFETKLQASGWDLVQYDPARGPVCRTTGFSGTNDSRHQLPMTIGQNDLPKLAHTNAEVLAYLLEPRNRHYVRMVNQKGGRLSEEDLLRTLFERREPIRILIDAGAQILEHDNHSLAKAWLKMDYHAHAAVFFDSDHRPWVLYRKGKKIPLIASPFAENMEDCLVYLDESHCRGTDLKLPTNARAALTLGPHVTKDALAQAAMRLRLLGQSQAVTFFSPPEVHQSILDLRKKPESTTLDSADVVSWLLEQSCNGIEQLEPLYFNQGSNYLQQVQAKIDNPDMLHKVHQRERFLNVVQSRELHTLKQLYEPKSLKRSDQQNPSISHPSLRTYADELYIRKKRFQDRGIAIHSSALEEVEQEREVEFEVESVRETQKPVHFQALKIPGVHKDLVEYAKAGQVIPGSQAYQPMLSALQKTACGIRQGAFSIPDRPPALFVSTQHSRTVSFKSSQPNDNFIRPVQWLLWSSHTETAVIISPEEADALIPLLRRHRPTKKHSGTTHLIVYSAPVTRRMLHFNNLDYHATPPLPTNMRLPDWLKVEVGIFAGRLYFEWSEYEQLSAYLGMATDVEPGNSFAAREAFVKKPLTFLHEWLAVLRKGQDFEHTPMGFVTTGKSLSADHPFFLAAAGTDSNIEANAKRPVFAAHQEEEDSDDDGHDDDHLFEQEDGHDATDDEPLEDEIDEDNTFFDADETSFDA